VTDAEVEAQISAHRAAIEALEALKRARATTPSTPTRSAPAAARRQPTPARRWELAARAFRRFPLEAHTVRRICANHTEWATKLTDGAWYVDADQFAEFANRVERGEASFAVSAKSALSVAADEQLAISFDQQSIHEPEDTRRGED
jgi:hypothetical protein